MACRSSSNTTCIDGCPKRRMQPHEDLQMDGFSHARKDVHPDWVLLPVETPSMAVARGRAISPPN